MAWVEILYYYNSKKTRVERAEVEMASKNATRALRDAAPEKGGGVMLYCDLGSGYVYTSGPHGAGVIRAIDASVKTMPEDSEVVPVAAVSDVPEYYFADSLAGIIRDGIAERLKRFGKCDKDAAWGAEII